MKTTLEIPDALFRRAKACAAKRGISLRELVTEAISEKLGSDLGEDKPWMKQFGALSDLHEETNRINEIIEQEFGQVESKDLLNR